MDARAEAIGDHRTEPIFKQLALLVVGLSWAVAHPNPEFAPWQLPEGVAPPPVPADNPLTPQKVALGERLFADTRLSVNNTTSCATCHQPDRAFTDGRALAIGATGDVLTRNSPTLWNVAYNLTFTWTDQQLTTLEAQHLVPLTNQQPLEMGFDDAALQRLRDDADLRALHAEAFGDATMSLTTVTQALASYVRTLVKLDRPFDRYFFFDDDSEFDQSAKRGMQLFFSERLSCGHCHAGEFFSGPVHRDDDAQPVFHRTAVSNSQAAFRAPSLKFLSETAPYMHDGSLATLDAVVDFYAAGGGNNAERLKPFELNADERADLISFLLSL